MMTREQRRKLPRAELLRLMWSWRYFYFARFRLANAHQFQIGWLTVICRASYLENVARQQHPWVFEA